MKNKYKKNENYCNFGRVHYLFETEFNTFKSVYPHKKKPSNSNKRQLSLFNFDNEAF